MNAQPTLSVIGGATAAFSYAALSSDVEVECRAAAERIKVRMKRTTEDIIAIGKELIAVKERLGHGLFALDRGRVRDDGPDGSPVHAGRGGLRGQIRHRVGFGRDRPLRAGRP